MASAGRVIWLIKMGEGSHLFRWPCRKGRAPNSRSDVRKCHSLWGLMTCNSSEVLMHKKILVHSSIRVMLEIGNSTSTERPPDKAGIANANPHTVEFPVLRTRQLAEAEPCNDITRHRA